MSSSEINLDSTHHRIALLLVMVLLVQSIVAWVRLLRTVQLGQQWLDRSQEPRAVWTRFPEVSAMGLVMTLLAASIWTKYFSKPVASPEPVTTNHLISTLAITGGIGLMLTAILLTSQRSPAEYGLRWKGLLVQLRDGVNGFSLALLPTAGLLLLTAPLRNRDNQNSLLKLLADSPDLATVVLIWVAAAVIAPLCEEMMFRVILQGSLTSLTEPKLAIPLTAVAFAAIHGLIDGIALLPLAAVLGYVFDRRHSYVSVLVIHGLFNATMLTLALLTQTTTQ